MKLTNTSYSADLGRIHSKELDPVNAAPWLEGRASGFLCCEQYKLIARVANKYGGNVKNVISPGGCGVRKYTHPMGSKNNAGGIR